MVKTCDQFSLFDCGGKLTTCAEVGDFVEQDEEIATIETDKIDVAVNAPEAGIIKEFLVNEEDTVTVGQEIVKLEPGAAPEGGKKEASQDPKEPASQDQETSSQPEGQQEQSQPEAPKEESKPAPPKQQEQPKQESKPEPKKDTKPKEEPKPATPGSREERRVCLQSPSHTAYTLTIQCRSR